MSHWLEREGLDVALTKSVADATNGYALHVQDAIRLLREDARSAALEGLSRSDVVARSSDQAWARLSGSAQRACTLLAPYAQPPSRSRLSALLKLDPLDWHRIRSELLASGFFIPRGDEPWFHDLRRRHLWLQGMTQDVRQHVAQITVRTIFQSGAVTHEDMSVVAAMFDETGGRLDLEDPQAAYLCRAQPDVISLCAALMDLSEVSAPDSAIEAVLLRARDAYGASPDVSSALSQAVDEGLVGLVSGERLERIRGQLSEPASWIVAARAALTSGRLPVPGLASLTVEVLRPALSPFRTVALAVDRFDAADASQIAKQLQRLPEGGVYRLGRTIGPSLLLHVRLGETDVSGAAAYASADARDAALDALRAFRGDLASGPGRLRRPRVIGRRSQVRHGGLLTSRNAHRHPPRRPATLTTSNLRTASIGEVGDRLLPAPRSRPPSGGRHPCPRAEQSCRVGQTVLSDFC